jgi:hypothetical protein
VRSDPEEEDGPQSLEVAYRARRAFAQTPIANVSHALPEWLQVIHAP